MSQRTANILAWILTLGIPIALVLTNVFMFMSPTWLAYQYSQPDFPPSVRFSSQDRYYFASESIEYIRGNRTLEQFKGLGVYEDREIKHMVDVRELVDKVKIILPLVIVLAVAALLMLASQPAARLWAARGLVHGCILTVGIFVVLGLFAAVGFNTFFTLFHRVFFEGDSWLFNYTDSLIQFYPLPFWFNTILSLVALTILESILIGAVGWVWQGRLAKQ